MINIFDAIETLELIPPSREISVPASRLKLAGYKNVSPGGRFHRIASQPGAIAKPYYGVNTGAVTLRPDHVLTAKEISQTGSGYYSEKKRYLIIQYIVALISSSLPAEFQGKVRITCTVRPGFGYNGDGSYDGATSLHPLGCAVDFQGISDSVTTKFFNEVVLKRLADVGYSVHRKTDSRGTISAGDGDFYTYCGYGHNSQGKRTSRLKIIHLDISAVRLAEGIYTYEQMMES